MVKVEAIVRPQRLEAVRAVLDEIGVSGITVTEARGMGRALAGDVGRSQPLSPAPGAEGPMLEFQNMTGGVRVLCFRHPGLEPGSRCSFLPSARSGTPGQARGDDIAQR